MDADNARAFLARANLEPSFYLQKLDLLSEAGLLVELPQSGYRAAAFLDDRMLSSSTSGQWLPLQHLAHMAARFSEPRPLHFIFHSGHVGSTLVSRLLDETEIVLGIREPLPLRTLADAHDVLGQSDSLVDPGQFRGICGLLLRFWGRGFPATQTVVVKATSSTSRLGSFLLAQSPLSRAVCLNVSAECYLATLLAGSNSPIDLRGHGPERIRRLSRLLGEPTAPLHALSLGELAAMTWLTETLTQTNLVATFPSRSLNLDFDDFLRDLPTAVQLVTSHFGLNVDRPLISRLAQSGTLSRYSKASEIAYTPALRRQILAASRTENAVEIKRGLDWLDRLSKRHHSVAALQTPFRPS